MGKMNRLLVLLLAVCIAGNACAFANDDEHNIKKEKNIPDEAVIRKNRAHTRTVYVSAESNYTITSTNYPSNYPNNADDIWYLQTDKGRIIQLTFVSFRLESGYDNLKGGDGEDASTAQLFSLSGTGVIPTDKVSSGNKMWLRFTSDSSVTYQGFYIVALSVSMTDSTTEPSYQGCSSYQWRCYYNGQCIQDYHRCNGYSDCYNGEDEYNCYDYTTEPSYYGCRSYEWRCYYNGQCIQDYQRCNGYSDCYYGEDEYNCYDVNPPSPVVRLVNGGTIYEGRVEVFVNGDWGTVCDDTWAWDMNDAEVICRQLGNGPAVSALRRAQYGQGTVGPIHIKNVQCNGSESSILDCPSDSCAPGDCSHDYDVGVECSVPVRLVSGASFNEGRVEVYHEGEWGTVCDDGWDQNNAEVVCHMLGFHSASSAWSNAHFGQGSGRIMLDDVSCQGNESSLAKCQHHGWFSHNCGHSEDAGVTCFISVRLVDGSSYNEGRVEVYHEGEWGTVCDDDWDQRDALVVCRMLGFYYGEYALGNALFGQGSGRIMLDNVNCQGHESSIDECQHHGWLSHNCGHSEDAGVYCAIGLRVFDGGSVNGGRVEIYHQGEWGTICDDGWDINDANVICRMAGFASASHAWTNSHFGQGWQTPIMLDDVNCQGNESSIFECQHSGWFNHDCGPNQEVGVTCNTECKSSSLWPCYNNSRCIEDYLRCNGYSDCSQGEDEYNCDDVNPPSPVVRLVNGGTIYEGRVEVFVNGDWGTVCDDTWAWDMNDAEVICRQLGYGPAISAQPSTTYSQGVGPIHLKNVQCNGSESSILDCPSDSCAPGDCSHDYDVGVECSVPVRLVSGASFNEGRVEVYHEGEWGTVCDDGWDQNSAEVVCRMLGFHSASNAWSNAHFGQGSGRIMLNHVYCRGHESSLDDCSHPGWFSHNCGHGDDAGVTCFTLHPNTDSPFDHTTEPPYYGCRSYEWRCYYNGQCIQDYQRCNGYSDCYYGEDEYNCYGNTVAPTVGVNPPSSVVRLVNGFKQFEGRVEVFVDGSWGTVCDDGWDIRDAEVICRQLGYGPAIFAIGKALYGQGVGPIHLRHLRCEGWESSLLDCTSDAFPPGNCSHSEDAAVLCSGCSSYQWRCYHNDQCIQDYQRCNGYSDCYYGEDEHNCYNEYTMAPPPACNDYEWLCHSSHQCIPHDQRCNENPDCDYGEDESDCNDFSTEPPACTDYEWRCYSNGECLPQYQVCNGYSDCYYGEDESNCNDIFHCADGDEIPMRYTCDRIIDCLYGEDEWQNCYDNEVKRDNIESYPRRVQLLSKGQKTDDHDQ
ncbi:deleted in malignant brain tumors 1 protein-like isoform X2 [Patiria miniata]|uniref:Deleted in malignant brain tumors 1 protein-like n=1 Tax=Patiria miniata TaxID=46514 RepID=A0A914ABA6_PATMI|nr:deleted in malignant brain tumors 1 protein-like isoform X2 [Patiria miniata]